MALNLINSEIRNVSWSRVSLALFYADYICVKITTDYRPAPALILITATGLSKSVRKRAIALGPVIFSIHFSFLYMYMYYKL